MRSSILAGFLTLVLPACLVGTGEITGVDEGGDGTGNGDGTGGGGGDGTGGGSNQPAPRVTASVDKTAVATELGKTENVVVTITGADGLSGPVTVTPSILDGATPVTGWTLTPTPASVDLTTNGSATVTLAVKVSTDTTALAPTLQIELASTAAATSASSAFTLANQYTITIPAGTGTGGPHAQLPSPNAPIRLAASPTCTTSATGWCGQGSPSRCSTSSVTRSPTATCAS